MEPAGPPTTCRGASSGPAVNTACTSVSRMAARSLARRAAAYDASSSVASIAASSAARSSTMSAVQATTWASVSSATASRCQAAVKDEATGPRQPWPPVSWAASWFSAVVRPVISGRQP